MVLRFYLIKCITYIRLLFVVSYGKLKEDFNHGGIVMQFLYFLEGLRTPVLDSFFSLITHLGSETLFLAIAIIVFWCVSKRDGYYLMTVGFLGTLINQFLKLVCQVPRPWVKDPNFTIVESARADAAGYSFPSGHTQNAVSVLGCPARAAKKLWLRILLVAVILLVGLSRMYLGVHTPLDVGVSLAVGAVLVFGLYPLFVKSEEKPRLMYYAMGALAVLSLIYVLFVELFPWGADIDPDNLAEGIKNGWLILGASCGMLLGSYIEAKYIHFDTKAPLPAQILKVVLGLALVLALKAGLKPVLAIVFGSMGIATAIRYFLLVIFAACVWPLTFRWFAKGKRAKKILIGIVIALVVIALLAALLFHEVTRKTKAAPISTEGCTNPLITSVGETMLSGHRAGGGIAPENTMMALKNCVESDVYELDVFEFDIHLTADGIPVLIHDGTLDRTSDSETVFGVEDLKVGDKTFAELKQLNMGAKFKNDDGETPFAHLRGEEVPDDLRIISLEEAFTYLESCGEYCYIIEIKNSGETGYAAADILYNTLVSFDALDRTVVGTFNNEVTAYMDSTYPDMLRSAGFDEAIVFYIYSLLNLPADENTFNYVALQIPTDDYTIQLGTSRLVNYAHKLNIAVQYWTINDAEEMAYLQSIGADAIMTDVPDLGAQILNQP